MKKATDFSKNPIALQILAHTGEVDGNDAGYRTWPMVENGDPLVIVPPEMIKQELVYAVGPVKGVCPYYEGGLDAEDVAIVRAPVLAGLLRLDAMLSDIGLGVLLVDAWREGQIQVNLWNYLFRQQADKESLTRETMDVATIVRLGDFADNIGSYNAADENDAFNLAVNNELKGDRVQQIIDLAKERGVEPREVASTLVTYEANLRWRTDVQLSKTASTAHGGGGATDIYMYDRSTGKPVCLGVPFDYAGDASRMDYFEDEANFAKFIEAVERDPMLRQYLTECGFETVTMEVWTVCRNNRRILYHACVALGATIYVNEPWHYNWPCGHGDFPRSGNGCQALLANEPQAVWSNAFGHKEAARLIGDWKWI